MDYTPFLSTKANETYQGYPRYLQKAIDARIAKICASPSTFSHSACFPYHPSRGQQSILQYPLDSDTTEVVTIFFRFGQDETSIEISDFGRYQLDGPGDRSLYELG